MPSAWPQAIVVDLDNTLHDYNAAAHKARRHLAQHLEVRYAIPAAEALQRYEQLLATEADVEAISGREVRLVRLRRLLDSWPQSRSGDAAELGQLLEAALLANVAVFDGALEAFDHLRTIARTMIVTEGFPDVQTATIEHLGISIEPDDLLVTRAHGVRKKDGSAYRLALNLLETDPEKVVVIGDNWSWDILAASQVGIWQIWVSRLAQPSPSPKRYLGCVHDFRDGPMVLLDRWRSYMCGWRF